MNSISINLNDTITIMYFFTTLHSMIWVNFEFNWLKCNTFFIIIQELMLSALNCLRAFAMMVAKNLAI